MRLLPLLCASVFAAACDGPSPVRPTPAPLTSPLDSAGVTLSGRILEVRPDGVRRPIGARQLEIEIELAPQLRRWVPVGGDGRYVMTGVPDGRFVKVIQVDSASASGLRFCATNTVTRGDTTLDVPLFAPGAPLPAPALSGEVFQVAEGRRMPVASRAVYFRSRGYGPDVWGDTDSDGRFSLCGIPPFPGELYMFCANDVVPYTQQIAVQENRVVEIDATAFHECL